MSNESGPIPFDDTQPFLDSKTLAEINAKFQRGSERMARMEGEIVGLRSGLTENTAITRRIEANTAGLVEWANALQGTGKVIKGAGSIARPIGWIAGAITAVGAAWIAIRGGVSPR